MSLLVIDVGTSGVRAAVVRPDGTVAHEHHREVLPDSPAPGLVEFDPARIADAALDLARAALAAGGPVDGVGITNQRASTVVWERASGEPVGPGLGWQDLRTVGDCLALAAEGLRLAPNLSATKARHLLDLHDPDRRRDLCVGTVDSWLVWVLSGGDAHITDLSNAAVTGLVDRAGTGWDERVLDVLGIPATALPAITDSAGDLAVARVLPGAPVIRGIAGDQQASMLGQGCVRPGPAKITFGTGGMLDTVVDRRPTFDTRGGAGTFPIVARRIGGEVTWGLEAIMLSAGTCVEWLRDDLGIIATAAESDELARRCETTDGVVFVPALMGLGTPVWDYGARGTLLGVTRGTGRAEIARAVLEGVAHRGADLLEAAETDAGRRIESVRIDGGMSRNATFVQALADASGRAVEVSPVVEATTLGAGYLAGLAAGTWAGVDDLAALWSPAEVVEPAAPADRERWARALERARGWHADLSGIDF